MPTTDQTAYSTGDLDLTIAARLGFQFERAASSGRVVPGGLVLMLCQTRGWQDALREDRRRQGKARAGRYTTIFK